ncbi:MAG TPA: 50S ribosomal protein L22 [Candidatus Nanoarchaeia archaeon]|nr:50S ribosomal protein L22 [Candidatus Nanoarchaeia archaeon]
METEHQARVIGRDLPISTKHAIEICKFIRGKNLHKSVEYLQKVSELKVAIPYTRMNRGVGHRPGNMGPGRYPEKAARHIIQLLNSLEANAQNKGLDVNALVIKQIIPNKAAEPWHPGRHRRIKMKRTHIEIVAEEAEKKEKKAEKK